jgi:hypothetical protein
MKLHTAVMAIHHQKVISRFSGSGGRSDQSRSIGITLCQAIHFICHIRGVLRVTRKRHIAPELRYMVEQLHRVGSIGVYVLRRDSVAPVRIQGEEAVAERGLFGHCSASHNVTLPHSS